MRTVNLFLKKYWFMGLLVVLMAAAVLTLSACGKKAEPPAATGQTGQTAKPAEEAPKVKPIVLRFASSATEKQAAGQVQARFAQRLKEASGGRMEVQNYFSGSLYSERTSIEAMQNKAIEIGAISNSNVAAFTSAYAFFDMPYVVRSVDGMYKVLDGAYGDKLKKRVEDEVGGKLLYYGDLGGFRALVNTKKEVRVPADLKGIKIRSTLSPIDSGSLQEYGANPTVVEWAEVYTALSQGVVDGEMLGYSWVLSAKHGEVLKYGTDIEAVPLIELIMIDKRFFANLPKDLQDILVKVSAETQDYSRKLDVEDVKSARAELAKMGMKFYQPTEEEKKLWIAKAKNIWPKFPDKVSQETINEVLKAQGLSN